MKSKIKLAENSSPTVSIRVVNLGDDVGGSYNAAPMQKFHDGKIIAMDEVTIASIRAHGVQRLLVYCQGKIEGDWPCNHQGSLAIERFSADDALHDIEQRCRCTVCGWRRADLRPDYSKQQTALYGGGWMMPP